MKKKKLDRAVPETLGLLYGVNPLLEALRAGDRIPEEVVIAEGATDHRLHELIELARTRNIRVRRSPRAALDRMVGNTHHQGVIARIPAARYADAEDLLALIASRVAGELAPLALVLDGVEDPRNLGAILRTAECAGVDGVFVPERRAAGLTETVAKASAGAIEHVPVARVTNLSVLIRQLKERNVWVVGTAADASMDYTEWDWTKPSVLVLGGEGAGLHRLVRENCDLLVRIPVQGRIESLNVSVAAGIILYEALRQRKAAQR
ncbi:MAG: 23S rRNA (guanosine(2251)-2'-O)-methyltransferase RlmB [Acidobacteriota bacterium]